MTVTLSYLSTLNEVLDCDDAQLRQEMGYLNQEVVTEYVFYLRAQLKAKDEAILILKEAVEGSGGGYEDIAAKIEFNSAKVQLKLDRNYAEAKAWREEVQRSFGEMKHEVRSLNSAPGPSSPGPSAPSVVKEKFEFPSSKVFLQGYHKGYYVSAQLNGTVECNRTKPLGWEEITIEQHSGDWIYLKSYHGKYLSAQPNGTLQWNRDNLGPWEQFEVHTVDAKAAKLGLKSHHGKWVSAQPNGSICVDRAVLNIWEYFTVKHLPNWTTTPSGPDPNPKGFKPGFEFPSAKVILQGYHKGYYVSAQPNGTVECNRTKPLGWEMITIERHEGNWTHLKSHHGKYLSAQPNGTLQWNRDRKGPWEQFEVYMVDKNKIGLKSHHGKWVSAQPNGSICVDRAVLNIWEYFTVKRA